ncbi:MAG: sn-glycerol-3-phosphate ABC transporter ATP-binding protein UgpC [Planctomycetes bacterium]|nr:sn-glycerol-3-phosphate ABC transporter ATP-binding protein UgpC [Planctomycetota bacterium]
MAGVQLEQLVKIYTEGQAPTVDHVDLVVKDGEFFILLGPSGCGKSTLLRMIAGLESITAGKLSIGERLVNDVPPRDRDIAMVFQSYALYPHLSVRDNLGFGLKMRGTPKDEIARRVAEVAPALGLEELLDRLPKALSGGQRQRVALGRAIVREPAVFLLDEPLSNLDAKLRGTMRIELKRLHQRLAATMIYVTHDQVEAMTLGDRIAVLSGGHVQQVGPPLEVYNNPANRFVAGFLGSPPMNFLPGVLVGEPVTKVTLTTGVQIDLPEQLHDCAKAGSEVELGVRPELLLLDPEGPLVGTVAVVEALGAETVVTVDAAGGQTLVARLTEGVPPQSGDAIQLRPHATQIHLFERKSGERLGPSLKTPLAAEPAEPAPEPASSGEEA